jgi:hypothetical protein
MTRGIVNDLSGVRFGHLVAERRNGSDAQANALWLCKCDCGNSVSIRGAFLQKRQVYCSKKCRFYTEPMRIDLSGRKFGRLTPVEYLRSTKSGKSVWLFLCDCGSTTTCTHDNVTNGHIISCGCHGIRSRIVHGQSKTRAYQNAAHRKWVEKYPGKFLANVKRRIPALKLRIPQWLTDEHWAQIDALYSEARRLTKETGIIHNVDHVYPLRGKTCSGLHVPWNLRVVTRKENLRKANRLPEDDVWRRDEPPEATYPTPSPP